jgi:hypothetical protein
MGFVNRIIVASFLASGIAASGAAPPDYFPLQVGNQWVLQTGGSNPELLNIEVLRSRVDGERTWFLVSGYTAEPQWVRHNADGELRSWQGLLARLTPGAPGYRTRLSGCHQSALPSIGPANPLVIFYAPDNCRDVGLLRETYTPGVGLTHRAITTFRGELAFDLVYAKVNGKPVLAPSKEIVSVSDFKTGSKGWLPGFADYSLKTDDLQMVAQQGREGYYLQSMNRSDDLFMLLKKHLGPEDGLEPDHDYRVAFDIAFLSNAPTGCVGIGGSPGDGVYLKAGATADEPVTHLNGSEVRLTADKGQQSFGGRDAGVVGTIANGTECTGLDHPYVRVRKQYAHPTPVHTDHRGALWLLLGTDSAFEGRTGLYIESVTVRVNAATSPAGSEGRFRVEAAVD